MKKVWLGLIVLIFVVGLGWGVFGRGGGGPQVRTVNLSVIAQKLYGAGSGGVVRVKQGDTITLRITADEPMLVFLHSYDLETRVKPGENAYIKFTANLPGLHAFMVHTLGEGSEERRVEILLGLVNVQLRR